LINEIGAPPAGHDVGARRGQSHCNCASETGGPSYDNSNSAMQIEVRGH